MSQINANAILDASGGTTASINGYTPSASNMTGRNRIINGAMMIDQRNAGASVTISNADDTYCMDRFLAAGVASDGVFTVQQVTEAPAGFSNSAKLTVTTADTTLTGSQSYQFQQKIEGFNTADLAFGTASAKTITLSFWVRSSLTGTFGGAFSNASFNRSYPFTYNISVADTWEYKTVTIAGDTSGTWIGGTNGIGLRVYFGLGAADRAGTAGAWAGAGYVTASGATSVIGTLNATFYITGVQLEVGSTASEFSLAGGGSYGAELALCQRYYHRYDFTENALITAIRGNSSTGVCYHEFRVSPTMRTSPTFSESGSWQTTSGYAGTPSLRGSSSDSVTLATSEAVTGPTARYIATSTGSSVFNLSAEL